MFKSFTQSHCIKLFFVGETHFEDVLRVSENSGLLNFIHNGVHLGTVNKLPHKSHYRTLSANVSIY